MRYLWVTEDLKSDLGPQGGLLDGRPPTGEFAKMLDVGWTPVLSVPDLTRDGYVWILLSKSDD